MSDTIGFIGLGMMGHGMAKNLLAKGYGLRFASHMTEMLPTSSFIAEAAHQSFVQASNLGLGDRFIASLLEAQQQLNAVRIVPR